MNDAIHAAGAVVWQPVAKDGQEVGGSGGSGGGEGSEVLLVHRPKYDDWSLPKGKREPGEHVLLTAVREVLEETSVRPVLGPRLPTVEYLAGGYPKRVAYWSARGAGGQAAPRNEVDAVSWLPLRQAAGQVSYPHDADLISGLRPRETTPLIVVRHASAGRKEDWLGDDEQRPLDTKGAMDAVALAGLLACFAPRARVLSSPALRCTQTVQPFAAAFGGSVETGAALARPGRSGSFPSSRTSGGESLPKLMRDLVAAGRPAVVCLHRENLPKALAAACSAIGAPSAVPRDPSLPKGGFWVVHAAARELAALEHYELLGVLVGSGSCLAVADPCSRCRRTTRQVMYPASSTASAISK